MANAYIIVCIISANLADASRKLQTNINQLTQHHRATKAAFGSNSSNLLHSSGSGHDQFVPALIVPSTHMVAITPILGFRPILPTLRIPPLRSNRGSVGDSISQPTNQSLSSFSGPQKEITKQFVVVDAEDGPNTSEVLLPAGEEEKDSIPSDMGEIVNETTFGKNEGKTMATLVMERYLLLRALNNALATNDDLQKVILDSEEEIERLTAEEQKLVGALTTSMDAYESLKQNTELLRASQSPSNSASSRESSNNSEALIAKINEDRENLALALTDTLEENEILKQMSLQAANELVELMAEKEAWLQSKESLMENYTQSLYAYESLKQTSDKKIAALKAENAELVEAVDSLRQAYEESLDAFESLQQRTLDITKKFAGIRQEKESLLRAHKALKEAFQVSKKGLNSALVVSDSWKSASQQSDNKVVALEYEKEYLITLLQMMTNRTYDKEDLVRALKEWLGPGMVT